MKVNIVYKTCCPSFYDSHYYSILTSSSVSACLLIFVLSFDAEMRLLKNNSGSVTTCNNRDKTDWKKDSINLNSKEFMGYLNKFGFLWTPNSPGQPSTLFPPRIKSLDPPHLNSLALHPSRSPDTIAQPPKSSWRCSSPQFLASKRKWDTFSKLFFICF